MERRRWFTKPEVTPWLLACCGMAIPVVYFFEQQFYEADARGHRRPQAAPKPSTGDAPPPRATASERRALLVQAEDLKAKALSKVETQAREDAQVLKQKFGADSEEYRDREAYWQHRLVTLRERDPVTFLSQEDQERLGRG